MRGTPHAEITLEALETAIQSQRPAPGLIYHIDKGLQYACEPHRKALPAAGITPSINRKGRCMDNVPMESVFHSLKVERVHDRTCTTRGAGQREATCSRDLGPAQYPPPPLGAGHRSPATVVRTAA